MRIWFDTEFIENGKTIELLSIGMVREDGKTYYAEVEETDRSLACDWVKHNVITHLHGPTKTRREIAEDIVKFCGSSPELWAYYCSYDWVAICQLFGRMIDLPKGWPMWCRDIMFLTDGRPGKPGQTGAEHDALADAQYAKSLWEWAVG